MTLQSTSLAGVPIAVILACEGLDQASEAIVYASGSVVAGLGNAWSDLDVFVISDREPIGPYARRASTNQTSQHFVEGRRVDFEYWRPDDVRDLARRVQAIELGRGQHMEGSLFLFVELAFVDRLRTGVPLLNAEAFRACQGLFDFEHFRAFQVEEAIRYLDALLEDLVGMMESNQLDLALLRARDAVDSAVDAYLHRLGNTDPNRKWRSAYLVRCDDGSDRHRRYAATFWQLQFPDGPRLRQDPAACRAHLESCVRFANEVVTWIQG